jgi:SAM-dependent methyltransferase
MTKITKTPYKSFNGFGIDIACKRTDDLDRLSLEYLSAKSDNRVLDIGCGMGGHSLRLAKIGVDVVALDKHDFSKEFAEYRQNLPENKLRFICGDVLDLQDLLHEQRFTDVYMQRILHYLRYREADRVLRELRDLVQDKLFISVTGIESDIGKEYEGRGVEIEERFFKLNDDQANTFSIDEPLCLYSREEFVGLLEEAGWRVEKCWESAFGNIKAVCS